VGFGFVNQLMRRGIWISPNPPMNQDRIPKEPQKANLADAGSGPVVMTTLRQYDDR
jgi:hypothetical protein